MAFENSSERPIRIKGESDRGINRREILKTAAGSAVVASLSVENASALQGGTGQPSPSEYQDILANMEGSGTDDNPYIISNVTELQAMAGDIEGVYKLGDDIDASGTSQWDDKKGFSPVAGDAEPLADEREGFKGKLDGNGHSIQNLVINRPDKDFVGLLGKNEGEVSDILLEDAEIHGKGLCGVLG